MKSLFCVLPIAVLLSACMATDLPNKNKTYNPQTDARVRIFGQNGRPSTMQLTLNGKTEKVTVGGGVGQAFSSMFGVKDNESIGMPTTEFSKNPSAHSTLLSSIFFKEFIVPANTKIIVNNSILSVPNIHNATYGNNHVRVISKGAQACSGNAVSFTAVAGKDYEVTPISSDRTCGVTVYEITKP